MTDRSTLRAREKAAVAAFARVVGKSIRRARRKQGWTQLQLAETAGLSSNYVARLERGEVGPSLFVARKLCKALCTNLDTLTRRTKMR